ncbi:MAG: glycosyltransferase family 2 protein [Gammaproteobacteria bacterium]|nr:glycosyltransferase family 2 protein [Gammaproteobacteria bacterium]
MLFPDKELLFDESDAPSVTIIIPAHNEASIIEGKLKNTLDLYYPGNMKILIVSDGSTDTTIEIVEKYISDARIKLLKLPERRGKAQALNTALDQVDDEIVVFTDASIMLDELALWKIIQPFADSNIGCVSGEDIIEGGSGEGLYGKYELFLRNQESHLGSIVGASGSFYAQKTSLISPFQEGLAPDFLSVMNTVEKGYRVISYPPAFGFMTAVKSTKSEFNRKVRTLIRGMTALFIKANMLNPFKFPLFSLFLWSHKLMRWFVPFMLIILLISSYSLSSSYFFGAMFVLQVIFYFIALLGLIGVNAVTDSLPGKFSSYFVSVNVAILVAWIRYIMGVRQEIWSPSDRS